MADFKLAHIKGCDYATIMALAEERAHATPERNVLTYVTDGDSPETTLTFAELYSAACEFGRRLSRRGASGARVLLLCHNGPEFPVAFLGSLLAGAIAVPLYRPASRKGLPRLRGVARSARPRFCVAESGSVSRMQDWCETVPEVAGLEWLAIDLADIMKGEGGSDALPTVPAEATAFLQYTSGSTNDPKGVMVTHANLMNNERRIQTTFGLDESTVSVSWLPTFHDMGLIGALLGMLYAGSHAYMMPPAAFMRRPRFWLETISRAGARVSGGPNFAFDLCLRKVAEDQLAGLDLSTWRVAYNGAEPVHADTLNRFAERFGSCGFDLASFLPCYGLAEATLLVTGSSLDMPPQVGRLDRKRLEQGDAHSCESGGEDARLSVGCGAPSGDRVVIVCPESRVLLESGRVGEIWVTGSSVAAGYWELPAETEATFGGVLEPDDGLRYLRTGDLGMLYDGELHITGRCKDVIVTAGRNIYPSDIEHEVERVHPAVRPGGSAAFGVTPNGREQVALVCELLPRVRSGFDSLVSCIRRGIFEEFSLALASVTLIRPGSLPTTSSGKVRRGACRDALKSGNLAVLYHCEHGAPEEPVGPADSPSTADHRPSVDLSGLREWLRERIAYALGIEAGRIKDDTPLSAYGMGSVEAVALAGELEEHLGRPVPATLAWEHPSVAAILRFASAPEHAGAVQRPVDMAADNAHAIAVVGIGCRFPAASSPGEFWDLLACGGNGVRAISLDGLKGPIRPSENKDIGGPTTWAGLVEGVAAFDAALFGIGPAEAVRMDPQHRLLLETTWLALEHAGMLSPERRNDTGVFVGISTSDYAQLMGHISRAWNLYSVTGNASSIAANRVSYCFDFHGPSIAVDTACSSSLVAVHLAVRSLHNNECRTAIAGGVNLVLGDHLGKAFDQAGMLAADGRCKTFDDTADGYVRGEGCGLVVLKRLYDAEQDGDRILAVIRGTAVNQDGRSNGLTAPSVQAQRKLIRAALDDAGLSAARLGYVEAHGTGTPLGDPIEVRSLKDALDGAGMPPCAIGSVKTNVGHLEAAAGIAGFIKTVLMLGRRAIPPHRNFKHLNRHIDLEQSRLYIPLQLLPWHRDSEPRCAGVASFGFGGTNAYVILEEAPDKPTAQPVGPSADRLQLPEVHDRPRHILALSAHCEKALEEMAERQVRALRDIDEGSLADYCYSVNTAQAQLPWRCAVSGADVREMVEALTAGPARQHASGRPVPGLVFMFPGQGSQLPQMGRELRETQPIFRRHLNECLDALQSYTEVDVAAALDVVDPQHLQDTAIAQPLLFALEYALARLWMSWGVTPDAVVGHSVGEYTAACIAGAVDLDDCARLVAVRSALMRQAPGAGAMIAVAATLEAIAAVLGSDFGGTEFAAENAPDRIVLAGPDEDIAQAGRRLSESGIDWRRLPVSHAFHSRMMEPCLARFEEECNRVAWSRPSIPLACNLTGTFAEPGTLGADYWPLHMCRPVRFAPAISSLYDTGFRHFLEVGPQPVLSGLLRRMFIGDSGLRAIASLDPRNGTDWEALAKSVETLHRLGWPIAWRGFDEPFARTRLEIPSYPFQRDVYWLTHKHGEPDAEFGTSRQDSIMAQKDPDFITAPANAPVANELRDIIDLFRRQTDLLRSHWGLSPAGAATRAPDTPMPAVAEPPATIQHRRPGTLPRLVVPAPTPTESETERARTEQVVRQAVARVCGVAPVDLHSEHHLRHDLAFDSLMTAALAHELEIRLGVNGAASRDEIGPRLAAGLTIGELVELLGGQATHQSEAQSTCAADLDQATYCVELFPEYRTLCSRLDVLGDANPFFRVHEGVASDCTRVGGRAYLNFSTYNYLGLSGDPEVSAAAKLAIDEFGTSVSASRPISGEKPVHGALERELADFLGVEETVVFLGGHATNETTIGHLFGPEDLILHDSYIHNSIIQGILLSGAHRRPFAHNDWQQLETLLLKMRHRYRRALIVIEGVYSMDGDIPSLPHFTRLKQQFGALLMVDEAHSIGTVGATGAGIGEHFQVDRGAVDIWMGTLSKALASCGGYIGGSHALVKYLKHSAPGFLFSVGISPANAAAALAALRKLRAEPRRVTRLQENSSLFLDAARHHGLNTGDSAGTPVIPVILGDSALTMSLSQMLFEAGINVQPIVYPAVDEDLARLRFFISADHSTEQLMHAADATANALDRLNQEQRRLAG